MLNYAFCLINLKLWFMIWEKKSREFSDGDKVVSKNLGKSRSSGMVATVSFLADRSDYALLQQHDGSKCNSLLQKSRGNFLFVS
jgi:hypothetical protein